MTKIIESRLQRLIKDADGFPFAGRRIGLEKESLRLAPDGTIAPTPHPASLGSALENRFITTDYSEALLEFVTPPVASSWQAIQYLVNIHHFVYQSIDDELLWPMSMPCRIETDGDVPLANYGSSNVGTMKTVYRRGLGYRYGRKMQTISGIHFNFSPPDSFWPNYARVEDAKAPLDEFRSDAYMGLVRNVRRYDWLLLYLFGASPTVSKTFLEGSSDGLEEFDSVTWFGPYSTSLRMSEIGYQNSNQAAIYVSANSVEEYIEGLLHAVQTPNPAYEEIGIKVAGEYRQLNANYLQVENEYYSTIRPKRVARSGERPSKALQRGGVEYVELRALDVCPFDPVGINQHQIRFLEAFLIYCLLSESPPITTSERETIAANHAAVAMRGREPGLKLRRSDSAVNLSDWGQEICDGVALVAETLDEKDDYIAAVKTQRDKLADPEQTPSARLIAEMRETGQSFCEFGGSLSRTYAEYFREMAAELNPHREMLQAESNESLRRQAAVEASDELGFDEYVAKYYA